jgi:hypothetical protein
VTPEVARAERPSLSAVLEHRAPAAAPMTSPWGLQDHVRLAQSTALGASGLLVGWYGLAQTVALSRQATFLVVGIAGLLVASGGLAAWLLAGLRSVRDRRVRVRTATVLVAEGLGARTAVVVTTSQSEGLVATDAMTRYHRPDCLLVEGKMTDSASASDHERSGRSSCPVCVP